MSNNVSSGLDRQETHSDLVQSLRAESGTARRRQRQSWVLSAVWLAAILGVGAYVSIQVRALEEKQAKTELVAEAAIQGLSGLNEVRQEVFALKDSTERAAAIAKLDPFSAALELAQVEVDRRPLSTIEKQLLTAQRAVAQSQDSPKGLYLVGSGLIEDDSVQAVAMLALAVAKDPGYEPAQVALGKAYSWSGHNQEAFDQLIRSAALNPNRAYTYAELCWVLMALDKSKEAVERCNRSIELDGRNWPAFHYRAFADFRLGQFDAALEDWRKASSLRGEAADSLENLGLVYLAQKDWKQARDNAQMVNLLNAKSSWNWLFLAIAEDHLGGDDHARPARDQWKHLKAPSDVTTLKFLLPADLTAELEAK
jgi:tetratricopeptide (TPR) repeat protein